MTSKIKVLMGCLGALLALSALGVGVAQAAQPRQPQFTTERAGVTGETIKSNLTIEDVSARTRLWSTALGVVIRCEKDESEGFLEPNGRNTGTVTYRECKLFTIKENAAKQLEEGEDLSAKCKVKEPITTVPLTSRLVWQKGGTRLLILYGPKSGTEFVKIVIEQISGCNALLVSTFPVSGSVLAWAPRFNEEWIAGFALFNTLNGNKEVVQAAKEWEVKEVSPTTAALETGSAELTLGASKKAALEGVDQTERVREGSGATAKRGLWGIRE
jgi:hypothetical protein